MSLSTRDQHVIWHPYTQMQNSPPPVGILRAEGALLFGEDDRQYIDAVSSWWVTLHGHANPYIAEKVFAQMNRLEHVIFAGFTHAPAVELAERLCRLLPSNQRRMFYSDNGSTAVEVAVKMALQYWSNLSQPKRKILALENSYHGDTFGAMSVSARSSFTQPFSDLLFDVVRLPFPERGHNQQTWDRCKAILDEHDGAIAALIIEPLVLGAGGMLMYDASFLDQLFQLCQERNILVIADEVMTGFGRTGQLFACGYLTHQPDIMCLSKGITGGVMPLGATTCTEKIFSGFLSDDKAKTFFHGHSYTANPVACSAALASLDILESEASRQDRARIEEQHRAFMTAISSLPFLENVRCCGTILAMDFVSREGTSYFNSLRDRLYDFFLERGVLLRPLGNTVYIMPPYCISTEQLQRVYDVILEAGRGV